ncbi:pleckstrin homology domain-containing protein, partial [Trifolium pratense]
VKISRLSESQTTAASVDPIIQIGVLNISEVRFKVSMAMSPSQRPRGVLGFWASLMTALGNMENMPLKKFQVNNRVIKYLMYPRDAETEREALNVMQ